jgi:hypothetical protein
MPSVKSVEHENSCEDEPVEDHLEVDKPISTQNFVCVSFLSPEKILKSKEEFTFYHYYKCKIQEHQTRLKTNMDTLLEKAEDGKVKLADIVHLKKNMEKGFDLDTISFEEWKEKYEDFLFSKGVEIGDVFDKSNNFQTSIRGVKVRGTYDSYREAEIRAKVLQKLDPLFDVFVGQVGYWLAWSPDTNLMENQEHSNDNLNELMKGKKDNAAQRDMFFEERKREMTENAAKENAKTIKKNKELREQREEILRNKEIQEPSKIDNDELDSILNNDNDNDDNDELTQTVDSLQETDPWLERKKEQETP